MFLNQRRNSAVFAAWPSELVAIVSVPMVAKSVLSQTDEKLNLREFCPMLGFAENGVSGR